MVFIMCSFEYCIEKLFDPKLCYHLEMSSMVFLSKWHLYRDFEFNIHSKKFCQRVDFDWKALSDLVIQASPSCCDEGRPFHSKCSSCDHFLDSQIFLKKNSSFLRKIFSLSTSEARTGAELVIHPFNPTPQLSCFDEGCPFPSKCSSCRSFLHSHIF